VTLMMVEEKPDVTYSDIGGCKEQIDKMREVVELPMLHPEKFVQLGIDPPKGVLCYGPPGNFRGAECGFFLGSLEEKLLFEAVYFVVFTSWPA
jgi:AAA+ superfamily predicted ATPase